ncbi:hypothetical protein FQA39_LY16170 [Lamprigera yunnana]|nr:hypothetical protein FQA39_LY16170 [Lamprigera yunnana]
MSVDKFGRLYENMRRVAAASGSSLRGPPGSAFKLTPENDYDMDNRRLTNIMDHANSSDVLNLKYYLSSRNKCGGSCLLEILPYEIARRAYAPICICSLEMARHYTAYFHNTNAEMRKIVVKINSVHYAVERDINEIIANIIPSVVKTMVLELVRENDMLIAELKTRFISFTPQVMNIQKENLTKIPNSTKIAVEESTKERNIIVGDLKAQLYNLNKRIELLDEGEEGESENKRPKFT